MFQPPSPRGAGRRLAFALAAALLLACGGSDSPGPGTNPGGGVASIQVSGGGTVSVGRSTTLSATARDRNGAALTGISVSWSSSAAAVATVSSTGDVTGVGVGTATITATSSGVSGSATVTVTPDDTPASIALSLAGPVTLAAGGTASLGATVRAADGHVVASAPLTYASTDANVAAVTNGVVTAGRSGTATITAASGAASASVVVTVVVGPPALLFLRNSPAGIAGGVLAPQPVIEVRDKGGNIVTTATNTVTVTMTGGGSLTGTTVANAVAGVATFTDLAVAGGAGAHVLTFTTAGLTGTSTIDFVLTAATTPVIAMDTTSLALTAISGTTQSFALGIRNGGPNTLGGLAVTAPVDAGGSPAGWLSASIVTTTTAPTTLILLVNAVPLLPGNYRATVKVTSPVASNSPVTVSVSVTVVNGTFLTFGTPAEKLRILDVASSFAPALSARDGQGVPTATGAVSYGSRATSVATVNAQGAITAVGEGATWVVVTGTTSADSVFVVVPVSATGPVLRSDLTTTTWKVGDAVTANVYLDTRTTPVGAVTIALGYSNNTSTVFSGVAFTVAAGAVGATVNPGVIRVTAASATQLTGQVPLIQFRFSTPRANSSGVITLTVTEIVAPDGSNLLARTTSTRIPVIVP
ncbi:MAG: Ig-like domain-containing protein [Gemmatimonadaceae bacterium]